MNLLKKIWGVIRSVLLAIGKVLGRINTTILLTLLFYLLLLPVSLIRQLLERRQAETGWIDRAPLKEGHYKKQY
ncbi:MAG: hypothetical protein WAO20_07975 [Acidobacteriota bacterium]